MTAPTTTSPSPDATLINGETITVSATTTDTPDRIDWVVDRTGPGTGGTIIATDASSPYSQSYLVALSVGAHTLVARSVKGALNTDSAELAFTIADPVFVVDTLLADATLNVPNNALSIALVRGAGKRRLWAGGGGGVIATGGGGGGAYSEDNSLPQGSSQVVAGLAGGAAATSAANATVNTTELVAEGGKSGLTQAGGLASNGTGTVKFDGGNGAAGAGNTTGGGGAGETASGSSAAGGAHLGGRGVGAAAGRWLSAGGGSAAAAQQAGHRGEFRAAYVTAATAGFPRPVGGITWGRDTADSAVARTVTMPSGIVAGDLLLLFITSDGASITFTVTGWTLLVTGTDAAQVTHAIYYKVAAGGDTISYNTSASESTCYFCMRVANAGTPEAATAASGSSTNADPPSITPSASKKWMFIATAGWDSTPLTLTGFPANYGTALSIPAFGANTDSSMGLCIRYLETGAAENPGTFTSGTEQWVTNTIAVPPA